MMAALVLIPILLAIICIHDVAAFGTTTMHRFSIPTSKIQVHKFPLSRTKMIPNEREPDDTMMRESLKWDPLEFHIPIDNQDPTNNGGSSWLSTILPLLFLVGAIGVVGGGGTSNAWASITTAGLSETTAMFDPSNFQPVCPASDGIYNIMKTVASTLVGKENVVEYGPLIARVLLRIRLELCVLESFLYEAVVPFIQKKGLSWVLPLHETVETFLAGTIFAVGTNFILLGSTKILSILFIYADVIVGMPSRFVGNQMKKASGVPATFGTILKTGGEVLGGVRNALEAGDTFVGRYLVICTTIYVTFKLAHYKLFNDLIPF